MFRLDGFGFAEGQADVIITTMVLNADGGGEEEGPGHADDDGKRGSRGDDPSDAAMVHISLHAPFLF